MDYTLFNLAIVFGFLLLTLLIGLYAGRGIKDLREYAVANKMYGPGVLTLTFLATIIEGGVTFRGPELAFSSGILPIIAVTIGVSLGRLFVGRFLIPKMVTFTQCITLGEIMKELYGKKAQIITGLIGSIGSMGFVAAQIVAIGYVFQHFLNLHVNKGIILGGCVLVLYSSFGGIKSVTITDVIQFCMIVIIFPMIANLVTQKVGGTRALFSKIPSPSFQVFQHKDFYKYLVFIFSWYSVTSLAPPYVQRILMSRDKRHAQYAHYVMGGFVPVYLFLALLIGFGSKILYPDVNPLYILPNLVKSLLPQELVGFATAGLLAVVMSSADSYLNSLSLLGANDVLKPLANTNTHPTTDLRTVRFITLAVGIGSICLALFSKDIIQLLSYAAGAQATIITIPLICGILGLKSSEKCYLSSVAISTLVFILCNFLLPKSIRYLAMPIGMIANGVAFLFMHWYENKGFLYEPYKGYIPPKEMIRNVMKEPQSVGALLSNFIKKYFPTPRNILQYSRKKVSEYGESHMLLSIFLSLNYMAPYFMWTDHSYDLFHTVFILRLIGAVLCLGFLLKPLWPQKLKPLFPLYWHATLLYCLPFSTTIMFAVNGDSTMWLISVVLFIMLLVVVVDWLTFLIIAGLGVGLGVFFCIKVLGMSQLPEVADKYTFIYTCVFGTVIGLVFARRRAINTQKRVQRAKSVASTVGHEINHNNTPLLHHAQSLALKLQTYPFQEIKSKDGEIMYAISESLYGSLQESVPEIIQGIKRNKSTIIDFKEIIEHDVLNIHLEVVSVKEFIEFVIEDFPFEKGQREGLQLALEADYLIKIPIYLFRHVVINLLRNAYRHGGTTNINIRLDSQSRTLKIKDFGYGIPQDRIYRIFDLFYTTSSSGSGVGLAFTKALIESFNGSIECHSKQGEESFTEFTITFPPLGEDEKNSVVSIKERRNKHASSDFWM